MAKISDGWQARAELRRCQRQLARRVQRRLLGAQGVADVLLVPINSNNVIRSALADALWRSGCTSPQIPTGLVETTSNGHACNAAIACWLGFMGIVGPCATSGQGVRVPLLGQGCAPRPAGNRWSCACSDVAQRLHSTELWGLGNQICSQDLDSLFRRGLASWRTAN